MREFGKKKSKFSKNFENNIKNWIKSTKRLTVLILCVIILNEFDMREWEMTYFTT